MTLPQGPDGVNTTDGLFLVSAYGHGDLSTSELVGQDQPTVVDVLKQKYVLNGNSVFTNPTGPLAQVWHGLETGISLPLSIIKGFAASIGIPTGAFDTVTNGLTQVESFFNNVFGGLDLTATNPIIVAIEGLIGSIPGVGPLIDGMMNALGVSGTGFTIANLKDTFTNLLGGLDLSSSNVVLTAIENALSSIPGVGPLIDKLMNGLGVAGSGFSLTDLGGTITNLSKMLGNPSGLGTGGSFDIIGAGKNLLTTVLTPAGALTSNTQIPQHLYGLLNTGQMLSAAGFPGTVYNLLPDPGFASADNVAGGAAWVWDAKDHTGTTGSGSIKTVASGIVRQFIGVPIPTSPGQATDFGAWAWWSGVTASAGQAICLVASSYDMNDDLIADAGRVVCAIVTPGAASSSWSGTDPVTGKALTRDSGGWVHLVGNYRPPAGTTNVRLTLEVESTVSAGSIWFDDCLQSLSKGMLDSGLLGNIENIPQLLSGSVGGIGGLGDIGSSGQAILDFIWSGLNRTTGTGKSFADVSSLATATATTGINARDTGDLNSLILAIRNNTPISFGVHPTEVTTMSLDALTGATDPPNFAVTSSSTPIAFWVAPDSATRGFVTWFGKGVASVTGIYIDLYKLNTAGTTLTYVQSSGDLSGQMGTSWIHGAWIMSGASQVVTLPGEVYAFALRTTGAGTHSVAGTAAGWTPAHALASSMKTPTKKAAVRTDGAHTNITMSGIAYSGNQAAFGFGINDGSITPPTYQPRSYQYTGPQTTDLAIPSWAVYIDLVGVGAGRGGGGSLGYIPGTGGGAGHWNAGTLTVGVDITGTSLHIVIGARGTGGSGSVGGSGGNGGDVSISATGMTTVSALGATSNNGGGSSTGDSPGNTTYLGTTYVGGVGGSGGNLGGAPGGGGGGGLPYISGKDGGDGSIWIVFRAF